MRVDYYKCDRCGTEGKEKFSHVEIEGHRNLSADLCNGCAMDLATFIEGRAISAGTCV